MRSLAALPGNPVLIASTHMVAHNQLNSNSGGSDSLLRLASTVTRIAHTCTHTHTITITITTNTTYGGCHEEELATRGQEESSRK